MCVVLCIVCNIVIDIHINFNFSIRLHVHSCTMKLLYNKSIITQP